MWIKWFVIPIQLTLVLLQTSCESNAPHLALGTLERDRIAHTATVNEVIVDLPVAAGSRVSKGTVLVRLDDTQQSAHVARAKAQVAQMQARLDKLRNGARKEEIAAATAKVAAAQATLTEASASYNREKKLRQKRLTSQAKLDREVALHDAAKAHLQNAQEQLLELTNGTRVEDLRYAQAQLSALQASLASEQKKLSDLTIVATRDGILDSLPWNLGERVILGSPLAIISAGKAPYVRLYVPEPYRIKMLLNTELNVHVDGLKKTLKGRLRWISTEPAFTPYYALNQLERSRLMYLAQVQLAETEADLPSGLPAQVEMP